MNFRRKILVTVIPTAILAVAILALISYFTAAGSLEDLQTKMMEAVVDKTAKELDAWVAERKRNVLMFSENGVFIAACQDKRREEAQKRLVTYLKDSPSYENIFLADAGGKIFMDAIGGKSVGVDLSKMPGYAINAEKARAGEIWVGSAQKSPASGRPVCLITAPIRDNGKFVGIMGTPVELNSFSDEFASTKIGQTGYLFILDATGTALSHANKAMILKVNVTKWDWGRRIMQLKGGRLDYVWKDEHKVAFVRTVPGLDWVVASSASADEFMGPVTEMAYVSGLVGLLAVVLLSGLIWLVTGRTFRVVSRAVDGLGESSDQVSAASHGVAEASQQLAQGASEQASSLEETSASLEELSSMTKQNADHAQQADGLTREATLAISVSSSSMGDLTDSMREISEASDQIGKIIKTIDEIAFQTNLLALNAAVEAARAGEAGAGFAVVAEEVRNLALRAGNAARDTAGLIEGAVSKIGHGVELVDKTNQAFGSVTVSVEKVAELVAEIAAASGEQAQGIEQINRALNEMDKLTQQNAATAEETASAAEEMNAQADSMQVFITDLAQLLGRRRRAMQETPARGLTPEAPRRSQALPAPVRKAAPAKPPRKDDFLDDPDFGEF